MRAQESRLPAGKRVLHDPWAERLGETHWWVRALTRAQAWLPPLERNLAELVSAHVVRHAALDALLREALEAGYAQVVIVGAGYDMRAARLGGSGVRWFEVDQPAVLDRKEQLLGELRDLGMLRRVRADLSREPLLQALRGAGWSEEEPCVFVAEGLVHYLPREAVRSLLEQVASGRADRRLLLSYITPAMVPRASPTFRWLVRSVREIPDTFFAPDELAALGREVGLAGFRTWSWAQQVRAFAPQAEGRRVGVSQEVAELVRGR